MKQSLKPKDIFAYIVTFMRYLVRPDTIAAVIVSVTVVVVTVNTSSVILQNYQLEREVKLMEQKVRVAKIELETQRSKNSYYATDSYLDIAARKLLGKGTPGEKMIIVPRDIALKEVPGLVNESESPKTDSIEVSNFQRWLDFLNGTIE